MKPDYEVLELELRGTAQLLAEERRNHAATAQALSDAEIGGQNAFVMAAAGHEYCEVAQGRPFNPAAYVEVFNAIIAAHDATTPSPKQTHVVVSKERLARLEAIEAAAREWTAARVRDGQMLGHSVIPTAQRLLDTLEDS